MSSVLKFIVLMCHIITFVLSTVNHAVSSPCMQCQKSVRLRVLIYCVCVRDKCPSIVKIDIAHMRACYMCDARTFVRVSSNLHVLDRFISGAVLREPVGAIRKGVAGEPVNGKSLCKSNLIKIRAKLVKSKVCTGGTGGVAGGC